MARSPRNLGAGFLGQSSQTVVAGHVRVHISGLTGQRALASDDELGEVAAADDLAALALGFEHSGRGPAQIRCRRLPALERCG